MEDQMKMLSQEDERVWEYLIQRVCATFDFSEEEKEKMKGHAAFKTSGMLPVIAGCENPIQSGYINMLIYLGERKGGKELFLHNENDDNQYEQRLAPLRRNCIGGDQDIIKKGFAYLSLIMLEDYHQDREEDQGNNKYNPLNSGAWNYKEMKDKLVHLVKTIPSRRFDLLLAAPLVMGFDPNWDEKTWVF